VARNRAVIVFPSADRRAVWLQRHAPALMARLLKAEYQKRAGTG
jgi:hypothetical protein